MSIDFTSFYNRYYSTVVRYLSSKVANFQDAEDLACQSFEYCYKNWDHYDPAKASIQSWLFLIVRSRWKNYCRDRKQASYYAEFGILRDSEDDFAEEAARLDELRQQVAEALQLLNDQQRMVIIMRYFNEMPDKEIADRLMMSTGNVRVIAHRALHKLEKEIKKRMPGGEN